MRISLYERRLQRIRSRRVLAGLPLSIVSKRLDRTRQWLLGVEHNKFQVTDEVLARIEAAIAQIFREFHGEDAKGSVDLRLPARCPSRPQSKRALRRSTAEKKDVFLS